MLLNCLASYGDFSIMLCMPLCRHILVVVVVYINAPRIVRAYAAHTWPGFFIVCGCESQRASHTHARTHAHEQMNTHADEDDDDAEGDSYAAATAGGWPSPSCFNHTRLGAAESLRALVRSRICMHWPMCVTWSWHACVRACSHTPDSD